jgi:hypothetical protein
MSDSNGRELIGNDSASDSLMQRTARETRDFLEATPVPDYVASVMAEIRRRELRPRRHGLWQRLAGILWTPHELSLRWRPAYVVAAAVAMAFFVPRLTIAPRLPAQAGVEPQVLVQFRLSAPMAAEVRLAGSFTNWQPSHQLHQTTPGLWTLTLPLAPGVHDYAFVVDGQQWVADPYALQVDDGFGGRSSRIALLTPGEPRS